MNVIIKTILEHMLDDAQTNEFTVQSDDTFQAAVEPEYLDNHPRNRENSFINTSAYFFRAI